MRYSMVPTTPDHIEHVAANMRQADKDEVWASAGVPPRTALEMSVRISDPCWTGMAGDEPICIFGVVPRSLLSEVGIPWLLGTDGVRRHAKAFLRRNKKMVNGWLERFELLENHVDSRNTRSILWLSWLGFQLDPPRPYGPFGLPFHKFTMRRS